MANKVLIFIENAPFGSVFAAEALRAGIAFAGMDLETKIVFSEKGVFCLNKNQNPKVLEMTSLAKGFKNAKEFGLKLFACEESLDKFNIDEKDIHPTQKVKIQEIKKMIEEAETIICF